MSLKDIIGLPRLLKILTVGIIVGVIWLAYSTFGKPSTPTTQYQTSVAEKGTLVVSISGSGQISNANSGSISTQASGVVRTVSVKNGDYVQQGTLIAELELDQSAKQNYLQTSAAYQSAKNSVDTAQQSYYALRADLFTKNKIFTDLASNSYYTNGDGSPNTNHRQLAEFIVAQDNWLAAEAKYKQQEKVVVQSQTSLSAAWLSLQETSPSIYAPISGTVTGLALQGGSVLTQQTGSTGTITSQKIASIKTTAPPTVSISLTEIDIPKVKIGNKATITLDAFPDKTFTGEVISIDTVGTVSSGVTTYPTVIKFDTEVENILSNMSAQTTIITATKDNVLLIPSSAVTTQNGQSTVQVMKDGNPSIVQVETGLASDTQTEITSGISEGETVVTSTTMTTTQTTTATSPFSAFGGRMGGGTQIRIAR